MVGEATRHTCLPQAGGCWWQTPGNTARLPGRRPAGYRPAARREGDLGGTTRITPGVGV